MDSKDGEKQPEETIETKVRYWDASFQLWQLHGNPLDDDRFPKPKRHPFNDHPWNSDWKAYCASKGMTIKESGNVSDEPEGYGEEEEEEE